MFRRTTPKIKDINAISELRKIIIGGIEQWLLIRGENKNNPLLLLVHGGPGAAQIGFNRDYQQDLEKHFIVVNWDQRGAGLSYSKKIPTETMNIPQFLNDLNELTIYLKKEFQKEKMFLIGHSWGSILGMLAVNKYPEHYFHYFGVSQVVSMSEAEALSYDLLVKRANELNNEQAIKKLKEIGKPPWDNLKFDKVHQKYLEMLGGGISRDGKLVKDMAKKLLKSKEYTIFDVVKLVNGQLFSMKAMINELREFDLKNEIKMVHVPITIIMGRHDLTVPPQPTQEFFNHLQAPSKEWVYFEQSAHSPNYEEQEKFTQIIIEKINHY
ncbi:proline iminopeptidase [Bacillus sp. FJAT-27231]|uniref:alpha/beta fold hydrolase n=1 Tax=Bacillus sp. FJAT-27231 TaxID=1679168 RepID=UPI00067087AC|nr:alpha/beta fold hydrolase [Bacillus sp. FJAT-27231]KMY54330.1 proline iminopeptidase [Bacillus sp. FJAT-27231]